MIYFDSDMSKSTNTVVYFDWKTVIYIYVCRKCRTQFMLPIEKSVTFTGACANEIIPLINRSFVYKAKEGRHVRITYKSDDYWMCLPKQSVPITTNDRIPLMGRCTWYNIMWSSLSTPCGRSMVSLRFLHQWKPDRNDIQCNWNIVESGIKHHNHNPWTVQNVS